MKKFILSIFAVAALMVSGTVRAQEKAELLAYNAQGGTLEVLVEASQAVDDLCKYINGSAVDVALSIYCSWGGDIYTCTAYKAVKGMCMANGALKLFLEGDFSRGLLNALAAGNTIYKVVDEGYKNFSIKPSRDN